jgi:hypothetical protein
MLQQASLSYISYGSIFAIITHIILQLILNMTGKSSDNEQLPGSKRRSNDVNLLPGISDFTTTQGSTAATLDFEP